MKRPVAAGFTAALVSALAFVAVPGTEASATTHVPPVKPVHSHGHAKKEAADTAHKLVASSPAALRASTHDTFHANPVLSSHGLQYVPYDRSYRGLPVVGGDFVVVTDEAGRLLDTSVAQKRPVSLDSVTPRVPRGVARRTAVREVRDGRYDGATRLVVLQRASSALAWETTVVGRRAGEPSRLSVYVDAGSGRARSTRRRSPRWT